MTRKEALEILGLKEGYTDDELKKNFKTHVRKYHPDNIGIEDDSKFLEIKEAYEYLTSDVGDDTSGDADSNNGKTCLRCGGTGFRREKVKTPRGYMARKVKCIYCNGTGVS